MSRPTIFFDGDCAMCNGWVQFVLKRDALKKIYFVSLQAEKAKELLRAKGISFQAHQIDTILYLKRGIVYKRSSAILEILKDIGLPWSITYMAIIMPVFFRDFLYTIIAKNRYRLFGKAQSCMLLSFEEKERIVK